MKKVLVGAVIASGLFFGSVYASDMGCKSGDMGMKMGKDKQCGCMSDKSMMGAISDVNLTAKQKEEMRELKVKHHKEMMKNKCDNAMAIDKDGNFNKDEFIKNMDAKHKVMVEQKAKNIEEMLSVLTPEQKKALGAKLNKAAQ